MEMMLTGFIMPNPPFQTYHGSSFQTNSQFDVLKSVFGCIISQTIYLMVLSLEIMGKSLIALDSANLISIEQAGGVESGCFRNPRMKQIMGGHSPLAPRPKPYPGE